MGKIIMEGNEVLRFADFLIERLKNKIAEREKFEKLAKKYNL